MINVSQQEFNAIKDKIAKLENIIDKMQVSIETLSDIEGTFQENLKEATDKAATLYQTKSTELDTVVKQSLTTLETEFTAKLKEATDKATALYQTKSTELDTAIKQNLTAHATEFAEKLEEAADKYTALYQTKSTELDTAVKQSLTTLETEFTAKLKEATDKSTELETDIKAKIAGYSTTFASLMEKIEGLLPGATAAGLASGFHDKANSYNNDIIKYENHFIKSLVSISIIAGSFLIIQFFSATEINLLSKTAVIFPLACLSIYFSARKSEAIRMKEEYSHKKEVAQTYMAYKKEVESTDLKDDTSLKGKLLNGLLNAVHKNPSTLLPIKKEDSIFYAFMRFFHKNKQK